jgi:hypothetical protein
VIIEMRSYDMAPGAVAEYEKEFARCIDYRMQFSKLAAFWHTEVGPLNRVIHVWPYENAGERDRIRAEATKPGSWPPGKTELIVNQEVKILDAAPFSPPIAPAQHGIYEIRTYTVTPGKMNDVIKGWAPMIPERTKYSPLIFAGATNVGPLNQWVHVWAYKDLAERAAVRREVTAKGIWPPPVSEHYVKQDNMIVLPAAFSPLS